MEGPLLSWRRTLALLWGLGVMRSPAFYSAKGRGPQLCALFLKAGDSVLVRDLI